jgi:hypothetical protein
MQKRLVWNDETEISSKIQSSDPGLSSQRHGDQQPAEQSLAAIFPG